MWGGGREQCCYSGKVPILGWTHCPSTTGSSSPFLTPGLWGLLFPRVRLLQGMPGSDLWSSSILRPPAVRRPGLWEGTATSFVGRCSAEAAVQDQALPLHRQCLLQQGSGSVGASFP